MSLSTLPRPGPVRFELVPERSRAWTRSRSSFVPISGQANAVEGWADLLLDGEGRIDLSVPPTARVEVPVERLRCGNPLYDWQAPRLLDAVHHPLIVAELVSVEPVPGRDRYRAVGNLEIAGGSHPVECDLSVYLRDGIELEADWQFVVDIRHYPIDLPPNMRLRTYPEIDVRVHLEALRWDAFASPTAVA
jgi:hypothetical protein